MFDVTRVCETFELLKVVSREDPFSQTEVIEFVSGQQGCDVRHTDGSVRAEVDACGGVVLHQSPQHG